MERDFIANDITDEISGLEVGEVDPSRLPYLDLLYELGRQKNSGWNVSRSHFLSSDAGFRNAPNEPVEIAAQFPQKEGAGRREADGGRRNSKSGHI